MDYLHFVRLILLRDSYDLSHLICGCFSLVGGLGIPLALLEGLKLVREGTFVGPEGRRTGVLATGWKLSTFCGTEGSDEVLAYDN